MGVSDAHGSNGTRLGSSRADPATRAGYVYCGSGTNEGTIEDRTVHYRGR